MKTIRAKVLVRYNNQEPGKIIEITQAVFDSLKAYGYVKEVRKVTRAPVRKIVEAEVKK